MPIAYPLALRERVVKAVREDGLTYAEAAKRFMIGEASVSRYMRRARQDELAPSEHTHRGKLPQIRGEVMEQLIALMRERPEDTLLELNDRFAERTGIEVSVATLGRAVMRSGFTRKKRPSKQQN